MCRNLLVFVLQPKAEHSATFGVIPTRVVKFPFPNECARWNSGAVPRTAGRDPVDYPSTTTSVLPGAKWTISRNEKQSRHLSTNLLTRRMLPMAQFDS